MTLGRMLARSLALLLVLSMLRAPLAAQERVFVHEVDHQHVCSVQVTPFFGANLGYGYGFVRVEAVGVDNRPHRIDLQMAMRPWRDGDVAVHRSLRLGPGERSRMFLPWPSTQQSSIWLTLTIDGRRYEEDLDGPRAQGAVGLLVSDRSEMLAAGIDALQHLHTGARGKPELPQCAALDLPADWRMFTGFHAVLVDGRAQLDTTQQEALRRFVHAGGSVAIGAPELLPAGALRELGERAQRIGWTQHGLGRCVALGANLQGGLVGMAPLPRPGLGVWPLPMELYAPLQIPGLGEVPITLFLLVILAFGVVAGPVNFVALRRRKQPMLALLTVPLLGLGTTAAILLYGMFHDGFGVRGSVRSWNLLDQRRHEVVAIGAMSLFTGFTPGEFTLAGDQMLLAPLAQVRSDQRSPHRWHLGGDDNTLDGGVLPSRTVTPLLTATQTACRQRLRVKSRDDSLLQLLSDGDLQAVGSLVLRDRDGHYWIGPADRLARCAEREAMSQLGRLRRTLGAYEASATDYSPGSQVQLPFVAELGGAKELPVGSYCGVFASPPWLANAGLSFDAQDSQHLVLGLLSPEDFLP